MRGTNLRKKQIVPTTTTTTAARISIFKIGPSRGTARAPGEARCKSSNPPVAKRSNQATTSGWAPTFMFLDRDTVITPDTVSLLLMRAGDVETNPGPDSCEDCGKVFGHQSKPMQCSTCVGNFCKIAKQGQKTTCIGLTRWQLAKSLESKKPLVCRLCKGEPPRKVN